MAYKVAGLGTYTLASSISSTATSITLTSFTVPVTGTNITMASMATDIAYGTIAPGTSTAEFISFTGITQNADGTATLTGVTRGLNKQSPYATSSSFKQPHAGQTKFILSNSPNLYDEFSIIENAETITGKKTFPGGGNANAPVSGTVYAAPTADLEYASKKYVDDVAIAGAPDASTSTKGITKLSYAPVSSTNPIAVGDNDPRIPVNNYATSTGSTNAYVLTLASAPSSYVAGQVYSFKANFSNTGAATLNVNGLGAKTIKNSAAGDLIANDILSNQIVSVEYDGTNMAMLSNSGNQEMTLGGAQTITGAKTFSTQPIGIQSVNYQVFTSSGTWTKPSNLTGNELVTVQLWGAGGGGGGVANAQTPGAGGGGGGGYTEAKFRASDLGATVSVTIGTGGSGGVGAANGSNGGNTTFGSLLTAYGGGGGGQGNGTWGGGGGGGGNVSAGSAGGTGTVGAGGSPLSSATASTGNSFGGGTGGIQGTLNGVGGASTFGGGGGGSSAAVVTTGGGSYYGGGGGGGGNPSGSAGAGGASLVYGGNGGAGGLNADGSAGVAPGGGGGGAGNDSGATKTGGAGARGECRVFVNYFAN